MGYGAYLKSLLAPLDLYDLEKGIGAAELESIGDAMDGVYETLTELEREALPATAESWGLGRYEEILPYHPAASTPEKRRQAVMALLRIDGSSFTLQAMQDTVAGCGIAAAVEEGTEPQTVVISFPGVRGTPQRFEALQERIEAILPCHLAVTYHLIYLTWQELETFGLTWEILEQANMTWEELERYGGEV